MLEVASLTSSAIMAVELAKSTEYGMVTVFSLTLSSQTVTAYVPPDTFSTSLLR